MYVFDIVIVYDLGYVCLSAVVLCYICYCVVLCPCAAVSECMCVVLLCVCLYAIACVSVCCCMCALGSKRPGHDSVHLRRVTDRTLK